MIGNFSLLPEISSMSLIQPPWLSIVLALNPMSLTFLFANSGSSFANAPSSVVHLHFDQILPHAILLPYLHRSVIFWVTEEDNPTVADEVMEVDRSVRGIGIEVWSSVPQPKGTVSICRAHCASCLVDAKVAVLYER